MFFETTLWLLAIGGYYIHFKNRKAFGYIFVFLALVTAALGIKVFIDSKKTDPNYYLKEELRKQDG